MTPYVIFGNGKDEDRVNLIHDPSSSNTERERYCLPDFAGKVCTLYKRGKFVYIEVATDNKKTGKQTSRKDKPQKTVTAKVIQNEVKKVIEKPERMTIKNTNVRIDSIESKLDKLISLMS